MVFVRELVKAHLLRVPFVKSEDNLADFFTKALPSRSFFPLRDRIMNVPLELRGGVTPQHAPQSRGGVDPSARSAGRGRLSPNTFTLHTPVYATLIDVQCRRPPRMHADILARRALGGHFS